MPGDDPAYWRDRPVLVTGCTGLLGSWLADELLHLDAQVVGIVRDGVPRRFLVRESLLDDIFVVHGDVRDRDLVLRTINEYEVRSVFHLAAQTIVGVANRNPLSTFESNVMGTWQVLQACLEAPTIEAVVVASSDKAYGAHDVLPYSEDAPLMASHPYDVSKTCADLIARSYAVTFKAPVCVTRFGNLFGGGDLNFNRLIPGTIRSALRGDRPIIRSDGTYTRDYIYVGDAVDAYVTLARSLMETPELAGEAFNFSYERPLSVLEAVDAVLEVIDRADLEPIVLADAANEIPHQYLSAAKARDLLGWKPRFDLTEGLIRTVDWYQNFLEVQGRR